MQQFSFWWLASHLTLSFFGKNGRKMITQTLRKKLIQFQEIGFLTFSISLFEVTSHVRSNRYCRVSYFRDRVSKQEEVVLTSAYWCACMNAVMLFKHTLCLEMIVWDLEVNSCRESFLSSRTLYNVSNNSSVESEPTLDIS